MIVRKKLRIVASLVGCWLAIASVAAASELSDGMQQYFDGNYQAAQQQLSAMIQRGDVDARLHYFRGLATRKLGNVDAAAADFNRAAQLELVGHGHGVGTALQRIQGSDRLLLERYRTMARLSSRRRAQPVAPKPVVSRRVAEPQANIRLVTAMTPVRGLGFRLASEVPMRDPSQPDPFVDDPGLVMGERNKPSGPNVPSAGKPDVPVGTGVAKANAPKSEGDVFDDVFDDSEPAAPASSGGGFKVFGAVFRALGNATIPQVDPSAMLPPGTIPGGAPPADGQTPEFGGDGFDTDDGFGGEGFEDSFGGAEEDFGNEGFADEEDPFAE